MVQIVSCVTAARTAANGPTIREKSCEKRRASREYARKKRGPFLEYQRIALGKAEETKST